jgi:epoxyqueuosine reductase QueG
MRNRLQKLAERMQAEIGPFGHRAFVDSAPVLERALARNAGLGWIGKHTCLIDRHGGSWFFLGELYVDLPLPVDRRPPRIAAPARAASKSVPPKPSSHRTGWTHAAASPT